VTNKNASAFNVARVMEQDFFELTLMTSCELFLFSFIFLLDAVRLCSSALHALFVQGYCMKSPAAVVSKWMQH
jgi:hypothetical protein